MSINFHLHLGTLTLMFLGHILHDLAEAGLWKTCLQQFLNTSKGELRVPVQLCFVSRWHQRSYTKLWNLEKGHPWTVSDICLLSPYLHQPSPGLLVCFFLNQGCDVELVYCIFTHPFQISSIQSRNFSLMLKFRAAILFLDMSVYLLKIFFPIMLAKTSLVQLLSILLYLLHLLKLHRSPYRPPLLSHFYFHRATPGLGFFLYNYSYSVFGFQFGVYFLHKPNSFMS